jgi:hypothetical protein
MVFSWGMRPQENPASELAQQGKPADRVSTPLNSARPTRSSRASGKLERRSRPAQKGLAFTRAAIRRDDTLVFSYQASSKVDAAALMAAFVERVRPGVRTIVHRDRDFMSDDEIDRLTRKYRLDRSPNMRLFITRGSDVESYFVQPDHLAAVTGSTPADERLMLEDVMQQDMNAFVFAFRDKREEIKRDLYRADPENCPAVADLAPGNQLPLEKAVGKMLLKKARPRLQARGLNGGAICVASPALVDERLKALFGDEPESGRPNPVEL